MSALCANPARLAIDGATQVRKVLTILAITMKLVAIATRMEDTMEIAIIGATGKTGIWAFRKAVASGHTVRAVVRNRSKLDSAAFELVGNEKVDVREADITDPTAIREALSGVETVIFAAGPVKGAPTDLLTRAADNIIGAMKAGGGKKIVWLTGAGVMDPRDEKRSLPVERSFAAS